MLVNSILNQRLAVSLRILNLAKRACAIYKC